MEESLLQKSLERFPAMSDTGGRGQQGVGGSGLRNQSGLQGFQTLKQLCEFEEIYIFLHMIPIF
jgi:hypothetical protein